MKRVLILLLSLLIIPPCTAQVTEVNFLRSLKQEINGAGPLLVRVDQARERIILVNTYTASVSLIRGRYGYVTNVPIANRIPQYVKDEALAVRPSTGDVYVIGDKSIHIIFPERPGSRSLTTKYQYEMVCVNDNDGRACLVGRGSKHLAMVDFENGKIEYIRIFNHDEPHLNLAGTPPPPIRKCAWDADLGVIITDGYSNTLFIADAVSGKLIRKRKLGIKEGARWHWAGYNEDTHRLYTVIETAQRKVVQAVSIDASGDRDIVVDLPGQTEGVGINYNPDRDEVYIPYDNHPLMHVVDFGNGGELSEIRIPAYGNDASAIDYRNDRLYVASWAYGEIDVIDLKSRTLERRIRDVEILPHMFSMDFMNANGDLIVPLGATAVNGSHGAAVTVFNTWHDFQRRTVLTGWAPVDLVQVPGDSVFLVFNSEEGLAVVSPDGSWKYEKLPPFVKYPRIARQFKNNIYLAYGPHQSYWPTVYIWAARNGILELEPEWLDLTGPGRILNFQLFDRRVPRLAHDMALDSLDRLYALQNSWGREKLMLSYFPDGIRQFGPQVKTVFDEPINRETIPRILKYDEAENRLYMMVLGNMNEDNGRVLIIDAADQSLIKTVETGITPTDLCFDSKAVYVANFDEKTVSRIDKKTFEVKKIKAGKQPFRLAEAGDIYVINYGDATLQNISTGRTRKIPFEGQPDFLFNAGGKLIISMHSPDHFSLAAYDCSNREFNLIHKLQYPYGEIGFDTVNASFSTPGQFGDAIFTVNQMKVDDTGRLWVTDFLSGRLFIVEEYQL